MTPLRLREIASDNKDSLGTYADELCAHADELEALLERVRELEEALRPFADAERSWMAGGPRVEIRMDWMTAAREVLDKYNPPTEAQG